MDPSGLASVIAGGSHAVCQISDWDCEAVVNVANLKQTFLDSATRHNRIPGMDNNGFAGLLASVVISERRLGNIPPDQDPRNRKSQMLEDFIASLGCTVSGNKLKGAFEDGNYAQMLRYFLNQDVPQRATVGIGNVWLETAANIWKGHACSSLGDCTSVNVNKLQTLNLFGVTIDVQDPFASRDYCVSPDVCGSYQPTETQSYEMMTSQLLSHKINIEYVAANLESGALRAIAKGFQPTAFNSATWHLRGLQTENEFISGSWNPGGAIWILDHISNALLSMNLTSSWNKSLDAGYVKYR